MDLDPLDQKIPETIRSLESQMTQPTKDTIGTAYRAFQSHKKGSICFNVLSSHFPLDHGILFYTSVAAAFSNA